MPDRCDRFRFQIPLLLDGELHDGEALELEAHLQTCRSCRVICDEKRQLIENIRLAGPFYTAPESLRDSVSRFVLASGESYRAPSRLHQKIERILTVEATPRSFRQPARLLSLASVLAVLLLVGTWSVFKLRNDPAPPQPSPFAQMAVDTHLRRLRGQLPLEIASDSPRAISAWFAGKLSFPLELPNYQELSGQEKLYHLEGARLVGFNNDYAAYVAYRMSRHPITLVVTSNAVARPEGGEKIISKGLVFHYDSFNGLKVITWMDRGLTYGLVSDLAERGQQSCIVCHTGTRDHDFIEGFKKL